MCRIEFSCFIGRRFLDALALPFGPLFWCRFGGPGRHYTPSGVSLASFRVPLGALLGTRCSHWALFGCPLGLAVELLVGLVFTL